MVLATDKVVRFTISANDQASAPIAAVNTSLNRLHGQTNQLSTGLNRLGEEGFSKITRGLASMSHEMLGVSRPVGSLIEGVSLLGAGGAVTLGLLAGLAVIGGAFEFLKNRAEESQKKIEAVFEGYQQGLLKSSTAAAAFRVEQTAGVIEDAKAHLEELLQIRATGYGGLYGLITGESVEKSQNDLTRLGSILDNYTKQWDDARKAQHAAWVEEANRPLMEKLAADASRASAEMRKFGEEYQKQARAQAIATNNRLVLSSLPISVFDFRNNPTDHAPILPAGLDQQLADEMDDAVTHASKIAAGHIEDAMGQILGESIAAGFEAAFSGKGVLGAIKAFGQTMLSGLGNVFIQLGEQYLKFGFIMKGLTKFLANPFTAAFAAIAIGAALIALSSALGGVASSGGGGYSPSSNGVSAASYNQSNQAASQPGVVTIQMPRDAYVLKTDSGFQNWLAQVIQNAGGRNVVFSPPGG